LVHSELSTHSLIEYVYPRGLRSKTWYLGRIARLFADPIERRWPDGNVWRKKGCTICPDLD
jgi:hypothetical protein